jgi:hypothetical protein
MRLHAICHYRSKSDTWTDKWRNEDFAARNLVKAVKQIDFKGSSQITAGGGTHHIDNTPAGRNRALGIVAGVLAAKIAQAGYQQASVVPIPSSSHVDPSAMFTGRRLAEAIQARHAAFVSTPILFFDQALQKSAGGGTRNAHAIQAHLRIVQGVAPCNVVLLDDVCTSGGHLKAAARFLASKDIAVSDAFVVARTIWDEPESMFTVPVEEIQTADLFDF